MPYFENIFGQQHSRCKKRKTYLPIYIATCTLYLDDHFYFFPITACS